MTRDVSCQRENSSGYYLLCAAAARNELVALGIAVLGTQHADRLTAAAVEAAAAVLATVTDTTNDISSGCTSRVAVKHLFRHIHQVLFVPDETVVVVDHVAVYVVVVDVGVDVVVSVVVVCCCCC